MSKDSKPQIIYEDCFDYEIGFHKQKRIIKPPEEKKDIPVPKWYLFRTYINGQLTRSRSSPDFFPKEKDEKHHQ